MQPSHSTAHRALLALWLVMAVGGCSSGFSGLLGHSHPPATAGERATTTTLPLRLLAAANLNAGDDGHPTAAVVKIYHLRDSQRFERAPFSAFLDQAGEQAALGADLLSVNEIVLTPGGRQELREQLSPGTASLGIVALFRAPAAGRWRLSYATDTPDLAATGITIGAHACALTASANGLRTALPGDPVSLAAVRCHPL